MKALYLVVLSVVFIITPKALTAQIISGRIIYKASVPSTFLLIKKVDSVKTTEDVKSAIASLENGIKQNIDKLTYNLNFNQKEAIYKLSASLNIENNFGVKAAKISTGSYDVYYYNIISHQLLMQIEAYGQLFLISSDLNKRKWVLTQESKTIAGYLCYKATSTLVTKNSVGTFYKPVIAWYALKLPMPYGPKGYGGLPGLIMQLKESNITFYVSKLTLNPKNGVKIKRPTKGKKVTQREFDKIGEESKFNFGKMRN